MKMKHIIVLCVTFSMGMAAIIPEEAQANILKYENTNDGAGNYKFSFETSNGIYREETGHLVNSGTDDEHVVVEGSFSYTDPDGKLVVVRYKADENGYQVNPPLFATMVTYGLPAAAVATLLG